MARGTYTWADGDKYVGEYKDSSNGKSKEMARELILGLDGNKYVGEYKDDKQNGQGTYHLGQWR